MKGGGAIRPQYDLLPGVRDRSIAWVRLVSKVGTKVPSLVTAICVPEIRAPARKRNMSFNFKRSLELDRAWDECEGKFTRGKDVPFVS